MHPKLLLLRQNPTTSAVVQKGSCSSKFRIEEVPLSETNSEMAVFFQFIYLHTV